MSDSDARAAAAVQLCCCWSIGFMAVSASPPARGGWGETHSSTLDYGLDGPSSYASSPNSRSQLNVPSCYACTAYSRLLARISVMLCL